MTQSLCCGVTMFVLSTLLQTDLSTESFVAVRPSGQLMMVHREEVSQDAALVHYFTRAGVSSIGRTG